MMQRLTLYSRSGCHLCEEMHDALALLLAGRDVAVDVVDIDADAGLRRQYDWRVPVLVGDGELICEGRLDEDAVRDALKLR